MINHLRDVSKLRKSLQGKKIVFVSGCFDIVHEGHIEFLEKAATLGDVLVVGVLSDTYIRVQKKRVAVHAQRQRARLIHALKPVNHVVMTPFVRGEYPSLSVLRVLRPHIFFRQEKKHAYLSIQHDLQGLGITLKALSMKKTHSTTKSIQKIRRMVV